MKSFLFLNFFGYGFVNAVQMDQGGKCLYNGAMEHSGNVVLGTRKWAGVLPRIQVHLVFKIWL